MSNKYSSILGDEEYTELSGRVRYKTLKGRCPTCNQSRFSSDATYIWNGTEYSCERDADGGHLQAKLFDRYELANIPEDYQRLDWEQFTMQPEGKREIEDFIESLDNAIRLGVGLYIHSKGLGTGKTFAATHILKSAIKLGHKGYYTPFFDILDLHQRVEEERRFIERKLKDAPLLVIDDVIAPKVSEKQANYFRDTLERVIRHRSHNSLSTVVTSNLTMDELEQWYDRIFSLASNRMVPIELDSSIDARRALGWESRALAMLKGEVPPIT